MKELKRKETINGVKITSHIYPLDSALAKGVMIETEIKSLDYYKECLTSHSDYEKKALKMWKKAVKFLVEFPNKELKLKKEGWF